MEEMRTAFAGCLHFFQVVSFLLLRLFGGLFKSMWLLSEWNGAKPRERAQR